MEIINTKDAVKTITKAVPTLNENGKVKSWDIVIQYSLNEYISEFSKNIKIENPDKEPSEYTQDELFFLSNVIEFDEVYESKYTSVKIPTEEITETVVSDFDFNNLK